MKKVILSLFFVLATGSTLMNATDSNDGFIKNKTENSVIEVVFGCSRDCVDWALSEVLPVAENNNEDPNSQPMYMEMYMRYYEGCLRGCD
jgi:L-aminopeptidase/D-esterase-like protein